MQSGNYREMKAVMNLTKPLKICFAKMSRVIMCAKMFKVENYFVIILTLHLRSPSVLSKSSLLF